MQNSSPASHAGGSGSQWSTPPVPNMYASQPTHQRTSSHPRQYSQGEVPSVAPETRRDEQGQVYQEGYGSYPQGANYPGMSNVNYQYGQGMGMPSYPATSPANPSRRTSAGKPSSTPPASAPPGPNPSPGSRYYPAQQGTPDPSSSVSAPSPYQPSSAPPQATTHQQSQPQTAHPYGGGYYNYYDHQHQQGQWPAQYPHQQGPFSQPPARPPQSHPQGQHLQPQHSQQPSAQNPPAGQELQHKQQQQFGGAQYDYSQYQYGGHDRNAGASHPQHQWPTPTTANSRYSTSGQGAQPQPWQGYPTHHGMPQQVNQHHFPQGGMVPGQYGGWQQQQQWNQGYGYPPITPHTASNPVAIPPAHGLVKKDSREYDGLGKRTAESGTEDEDDKDGRKKKGKKEEIEKPIPKPPAKSHLHPPRQAQSMWQLFFTDELNKAKAAASSGNSPGGTPHHAKLNVAQIAKDAGIAYSNLTAEQKAYYVQKVQESKDQYAKDLAAWQATLTPEDIRVENAFRAQQRKEGKSRKGNLKDPNAPKKPLSAYFLFLKGIREDDALRARVWGEETETTKQSVLAAERWRSLTDEEKKPFLAQAEHDKQEYEAARKVYEEDAAARARGEDVPTRTYPEPALDVPKPVIKDVKTDESLTTNAPLAPSTPPSEDTKPDQSSTMFPAFLTEEGSDNNPSAEPTPALDIQPARNSIDFGFADTLDMDLGGFQDVVADRGSGEHEWGNLGNLMGEDSKPEAQEPVIPTVQETPLQTQEQELPLQTQAPDVSEAPALSDAVADTQADGTEVQTLPSTEEAVQEVAREAEGELAVPSTIDEPEPTVVVGEAAISGDASGVPMEEVSEQPLTDLPPIVEDVPAPAETIAEVPADEQVEQPETGAFDYSFAFQDAEETARPEAKAAAESTEAAMEANESHDVSIYAPPSPKQEEPAVEQAEEQAVGYAAPTGADVPEGTTVEPAKDATEEATEQAMDTEEQVPAVDAV